MNQVVDVQRVFNKVIASGNYIKAVQGGFGMCHAVCTAWAEDVLTFPEYIQALYDLREYMSEVAADYAYLAYALVGERLTAEGIRDMCEETLAIYQDWENRPMNLPLAKYKRSASMNTFTPNPAQYTLQDAPTLGASCPQCALYDPEKEQCDGGPAGTWVDGCVPHRRKVWILRPEVAAE